MYNSIHTYLEHEFCQECKSKPVTVIHQDDEKSELVRLCNECFKKGYCEKK